VDLTARIKDIEIELFDDDESDERSNAQSGIISRNESIENDSKSNNSPLNGSLKARKEESYAIDNRAIPVTEIQS